MDSLSDEQMVFTVLFISLLPTYISSIIALVKKEIEIAFKYGIIPSLLLIMTSLLFMLLWGIING